ncbi:hypothetical protein QWI17_02835 [Gilvimarinus sp. SDUM040013]|uniref:Uncharacterized protein n=1 Tax=Gilvimarinus gilvus TaxID=3058038 RepID=A0ABU4S3I3_9GAMM|nr:hypothetical protein [Gilvimarinus sp. SDUM040013]MDO3384769.1 hypothetical protein [Gilvimarinus sp. SDUM040013]MDX6850413.1 hypothetical protein [Gilvimarinus sp. SDUM040013]
MSSALQFLPISRQLTQDFYEADQITEGLSSVAGATGGSGEIYTLIGLKDESPRFIKCNQGISITSESLPIAQRDLERKLSQVATASTTSGTLFLALEHSQSGESGLLWCLYDGEKDEELRFSEYSSPRITNISGVRAQTISSSSDTEYVLIFIESSNEVLIFDLNGKDFSLLSFDSRSLTGCRLLSAVKLNGGLYFLGLSERGFFYTIATLDDNSIPISASPPIDGSINGYNPGVMATVMTDTASPWTVCADEYGCYKWYQPDDSNIWTSRGTLFTNTPLDGLAVLSIESTIDNDEFTLYILTADKTLWIATGSGDPSSGISSPLPLIDSVEYASSVVGTTSINIFSPQGLSLFARNQKNENWAATPIIAPSLNIYERYTFRTQVRVADGSNIPASQKAVNIWSDHNAVVEVNGKPFYVSSDPSSPCQVESDSSGLLTIVSDADSIYSKQFYIAETDSGFNNATCISPDGPVIERLQNLQASDLMAAENQVTNSPLFSNPSIPIDDVASAIQSLANTQIKNNQTAALRRISKRLSRANNNSCDGHWSFGAQPASFRQPRSLSEFDWGGVWQSIVSGVTSSLGVIINISEGVINATVSFVINEIQYNFSGVIEFFEDAVQLIQSIFHSIGATIDSVISWLGTVFNWGDIKLTAQAISNNIQSIIEHKQTDIGGFIEATITQLDEIQGTLDNSFSSMITNALGSSDWQSECQSAASEGDNPENLMLTKLTQNSNNINITNNNLVQGSSDLGDILQNFYDDVSDNFDDNFRNEFLAILDSDDDFLSQLTSAIALVIQAFSDTAISATKTLLQAIYVIFDQIITTMQDILNYVFDIPLLSTLFKNKTQLDLTLGNLISLLLAIPATIIYKAATGFAPFQNQQDIQNFGNILNNPDRHNTRALIGDSQSFNYQSFSVACDSATVGITAFTETIIDAAVAAKATNTSVSLLGITVSFLEIINLAIGSPYIDGDQNQNPSGLEQTLFFTEILCRVFDVAWTAYSISVKSNSPAIRYAPRIGAIIAYAEGSLKAGLIAGIMTDSPPTTSRERRLYAAAILGIVSDFTKVGLIESVTEETGGASAAATMALDMFTLASASALLAWSVADFD